MPVSWTLRIAALLGFLGVALGAFGAHALKAKLEAFGYTATWETAVLYQFIHAVALVALAATDRASRLLASLWIAGVAIFSGSLYVLCLTNVKAFGAITPVGGVLLLAGWAVLAVRGR
jgi:uncharacterized membrane protein YgdD (TMEM256/DUF423 family)